jgi:hypothetical protein
MELNGAQKVQYRHQLVGAANYLHEIGEKHTEYWDATAEILAVMAVLADHLDIVEHADDVLELMEKDPNNRLDIVGDSLNLIVNSIKNLGTNSRD